MFRARAVAILLFAVLCCGAIDSAIGQALPFDSSASNIDNFLSLVRFFLDQLTALTHKFNGSADKSEPAASALKSPAGGTTTPTGSNSNSISESNGIDDSKGADASAGIGVSIDNSGHKENTEVAENVFNSFAAVTGPTSTTMTPARKRLCFRRVCVKFKNDPGYIY